MVSALSERPQKLLFFSYLIFMLLQNAPQEQSYIHCQGGKLVSTQEGLPRSLDIGTIQ